MKLFRRLAHVVPIVMLFAAMACASQAQPNKPLGAAKQDEQAQPPTGKPAADLRGTPTTPLIVQVKQSDIDTAKEQRQEAQQASDRNWTRGVAALTLVIGVLQVLLLRRQTAIMASQNAILGGQSTIMGGQLTQATTAANAAGDAARAAMLAQRPFVIPGEIKLAEPLVIGQPPRFAWQLQNKGVTPAIGMGAFIGFKVNGGPLPDKATYREDASTAVDVAIGSNEPYHLPIVLPFPLTPELQSLWQGDADLHFWVKLPYKDHAGDHHVTRCAVTFNPRSGRHSVPSNPDYFENT